MQTNENILLYKTNCPTCQYFMALSQKHGILHHFTLINVDGKEMQFKHLGVQSVPAIILKGTTSPIFGKNIMDWLNAIINKNNLLNTPIQQTPSCATPINQPIKQNVTQPPLPPTQNDKRNPSRMGGIPVTAPPTEIKPQSNKQETKTIGNNPIPYLSAEMNGISDAFAYTLSDNPQPKSFLSPTETCAIFTGKEGDKLSGAELMKQVTSTAKTREIDKKTFEKLIEQENNDLIRSIK